MSICAACGRAAPDLIQLATGALCPDCDALGRIAAAKMAYQNEKLKAAVRSGYQNLRPLKVDDVLREMRQGRSRAEHD